MKDFDLKPCPFCGYEKVRLGAYKENFKTGAVDASISCPYCLTDFVLHSEAPKVSTGPDGWKTRRDKTVFEKYNRRWPGG